jgi:hypothetical protein
LGEGHAIVIPLVAGSYGTVRSNPGR